MKRIWGFLRQYWALSGGAVVALVGLGLQLGGLDTASHWVLGTGALLSCIPLLVDMWHDIRSGNYGLNILAPVAIITAVILGQYWVAVVLVVVVTSGEGLEGYAEHRAHSELRNLLERAPQQAHIVRGRKTFDVAAAEVRPGDKILVNAGEVVPVDAVIIEGTAHFDESLLTGESTPAKRGLDEQILSGSTAQDDTVTAKALHSAADSQYQRIVRLVQNAAADQAPFVRLADRYSIPFTITAFAIAATAWILGHSALRFLEVIVVATPSALLLAAPIALVSGMSRASKRGIVVKTGAALEKLAEAETIAFGKTGTLTSGNLVVTSVVAIAPFDKKTVLATAAGLELASTHTLAKAIIGAADEQKHHYTKAKHVQEIPGRGLKANVGGKEVLVGQPQLLSDHDVELPAAKQSIKTATYVAIGGRLAGIIGFHDEPRPEAKNTLKQLKKYGIKQFLMLTGDNQAAADAVATKLSIDETYAEMSPGQKLTFIEKVKDRPVVFVGDGISDASVLTVADVGVALGARGSTAAGESADVVILRDSLSAISAAIDIARRTFGIARQSILVGTGLSLALMLAFSTGHFPPLLGVVLQAAVDVAVVFNALRAHRTPRRQET